VRPWAQRLVPQKKKIITIFNCQLYLNKTGEKRFFFFKIKSFCSKLKRNEKERDGGRKTLQSKVELLGAHNSCGKQTH
jgi:hypothetical protein